MTTEEQVVIRIPVGEAFQVVELDPSKDYILFVDPMKVDIARLGETPCEFPRSIQIVPCLSEVAIDT